MDTSQVSIVALPLFFVGLMFLTTPHAFASAENLSNAPQSSQPASVQLTVSKQEQPALRLEVKQAPLKQILIQIADKTGSVVHYSVLPEEPVTATCAGSAVKQIMECLLGNKVDRVYRQTTLAKNQPNHAKSGVAAEEIWILGARYGNSGNNMSCTLDGNQTGIIGDNGLSDMGSPQQALMRMTQIMNNPMYAELGKQALSMLAAGGKTGDAKTDEEIVKTLENALRDKNPEARAQAVFGLTQQDKSNTGILHEALQDSNADVRLMAVDSAKADSTEGRAVLSEALNDQDITVRALAEQKLNAAGQ
ncbi:MAG: HEAT repeat domain-containing protein [Methylococcaceae bacterium]|nr:HEAT repeat domain-containing protein [Methylococcaceae bacterium]